MEVSHNFLLNYLEWNNNTESPETFTFWCGLSAISCALGRRVWVNMGKFTIYPNMFVVLVAGSGRCRKSTSVIQSSLIINTLEPTPNLIAQKITPEALIDAIRIQEKPKDGSPIIFRTKCEGFIIVDELSTFLNKNSYDQGLASLLIPFYDCVETFEYHTKGGGSQKVSNVCLGMLGASTFDWLARAIPEDAIGGGLTSRIMFVYAEKPAKPVPIPPEYPELQEALARGIARISTMQGPFKIEASALRWYTNWYVEWFTKSPLLENPLLRGYATRRHMHLFKVAMLLSAADRQDKIITLSDVEYAHAELIKIEGLMPMAMGYLTMNEQGKMIDWVYKMICHGNSLYQAILRSVCTKVSAKELDMILDTLEQAGRITKSIEGQGIVRYKPTRNTGD